VCPSDDDDADAPAPAPEPVAVEYDIGRDELERKLFVSSSTPAPVDETEARLSCDSEAGRPLMMRNDLLPSGG
jgi:hypothetical protein